MLAVLGDIGEIISKNNRCSQVCVFTAPLFSAFCALATFAFVKVRSQQILLLPQPH